MDLTLFDDCHAEVDGEDSVHYSKPYLYDQRRHVLRMPDFADLQMGDDGVLSEIGGRGATLWEKLEDRGRWIPFTKGAASPKRPAIPRSCECVGDACSPVR